MTETPSKAASRYLPDQIVGGIAFLFGLYDIGDLFYKSFTGHWEEQERQVLATFQQFSAAGVVLGFALFASLVGLWIDTAIMRSRRWAFFLVAFLSICNGLGSATAAKPEVLGFVVSTALFVYSVLRLARTFGPPLH